MKIGNPVFYIVMIFLLSDLWGCKPKQAGYVYPSGDVIKDYFYRKSYQFPFYCDSLKPICKKEDSIRVFGKYALNKRQLAAQACTLIKEKFKEDSLKNMGIEACTMVPVFVYYIDSPVVWYRVVYREYKKNTSNEKKNLPSWQLIDSSRILATYHTLEFLVNEDGTLEYKCDMLWL